MDIMAKSYTTEYCLGCTSEYHNSGAQALLLAHPMDDSMMLITPLSSNLHKDPLGLIVDNRQRQYRGNLEKTLLNRFRDV